jgi:hypothetical protein
MGFRWSVGVSYTESKNALRANVFNECLRRMSSTVNQKKTLVPITNPDSYREE